MLKIVYKPTSSKNYNRLQMSSTGSYNQIVYRYLTYKNLHHFIKQH